MKMLYSNLWLTISYNFTGFHAVVHPSKDEYPFVDPDSSMGHPWLAEKRLRGSKIISFDLNVA